MGMAIGQTGKEKGVEQGNKKERQLDGDGLGAIESELESNAVLESDEPSKKIPDQRADTGQ